MMKAAGGLAGAVTTWATAERVIRANAWCDAARLEAARDRMAGVPPGDGRALARRLFELRLLTQEQSSDLEAILDLQPHFAGYSLERKLGSGGMGTVYLATQASTGRSLALKIINNRIKEDADFIGRFQRETKALAVLRHAHIAEVVESGESDGTCYMAMELIQGPSLALLLHEHQVLPEAYVLNLARQVAEGLAYVTTTSGLVHRDLKPENILVARNPAAQEPFPADDIAKLIDFGLVKPVNDDERLTQTGMTIGTPLYMSPEQIRGDKLDLRSDIYGLGATVYHLLTGITPFSGGSPGMIMSAHLTQPVPDPGERVPGLHPLTRKLTMTAMAKDREQRYLNFTALVGAIDAALAAINEKQGNAPKLLRKPLVLKPPPARKPADKPVAPELLGESGDSIDARILQKHRQATGEAVAPTQRQINPALRPASPQSSAFHVRPGGGEALRQINSSKYFKRGDGVASASGETLAPQTPATGREQQPLTSAVFPEDTHAPVGMGPMPWVLLGVAVVALGAWLVLH
jgi:serine/threonine protein kinase